MTGLARSRFSRCTPAQDRQGRRFMTDRAPYRYRAHGDNRVHVVAQGDTLPALAAAYFAPLDRACGFWWVIADFQPEPIVDPVWPLYQQRVQVVIPSVRVLTDIILAGRGTP